MGIERRSTLCVLFLHQAAEAAEKRGRLPSVCVSPLISGKREIDQAQCAGRKRERITDRNVAFEMHCGLNLVNAMVHGRDKKGRKLCAFPALLFENRQIKVRQEAVINIIEEAIRNDYNICLMKVNRHTNEVVGEGEMVLIHE